MSCRNCLRRMVNCRLHARRRNTSSTPPHINSTRETRRCTWPRRHSSARLSRSWFDMAPTAVPGIVAAPSRCTMRPTRTTGLLRRSSRRSSTLLSAGADPNAIDNDGTAPLHRAVRTRSSEAVRALLEGGADVRKQNGSGSTPLHLAVQDTGRGGSGSELAREEQRKIIAILLQAGASGTDSDGNGKTVRDACSQEWIVSLLERGRC